MLLLDFRSISDENGLRSFKTYLLLVLDEIIQKPERNTVQYLVVERLVGYYSTYRNAGDLDFRSGEIYNEIKKLSDKQFVTLAQHFKSLLESDIVESSNFDWTSYIKKSTIRNE